MKKEREKERIKERKKEKERMKERKKERRKERKGCFLFLYFEMTMTATRGVHSNSHTIGMN